MAQTLRQWADSVLADPVQLAHESSLPPQELFKGPARPLSASEILDVLWAATLDTDAAVTAAQALVEHVRMGNEIDKPWSSVRGAFPSFYREKIFPHVQAGIPGLSFAQGHVVESLMHAIENGVRVLYLAEKCQTADLSEVADLTWQRIEYAVDTYLVPPGYAKEIKERLTEPADQFRAYDYTLANIQTACGQRNLYLLRDALLDPNMMTVDQAKLGLCMQTLGSQRDVDLVAQQSLDRYAPWHLDPLCPPLLAQRFHALHLVCLEALVRAGELVPAQELLRTYGDYRQDTEVVMWALANDRHELVARALRQQRLHLAATAPALSDDPFARRKMIENVRDNNLYIPESDAPTLVGTLGETTRILMASLREEDTALVLSDDFPAVPRGLGGNTNSSLSFLEAGPWHDQGASFERLARADTDYARRETIEREPANSADAILARASQLILQPGQSIAAHAISQRPSMEKGAAAAFAVVHAKYEALDELIERVGSPAAICARELYLGSRTNVPAVLIPIAGTKAGIACVFEAPKQLTPEQLMQTRVPLPFSNQDDSSKPLLMRAPFICLAYEELNSQFSASKLTLDMIQAPAMNPCSHPPEQVRARMIGQSFDGHASGQIPTAVALDCDCCGRTRLSVVPLHEIADLWEMHEELLSVAMTEKERLDSINEQREQNYLPPINKLPQPLDPCEGLDFYLMVANYERASQGLAPAASLEELVTQSVQVANVQELISQLPPSLPMLSPAAVVTPESEFEEAWEGFTL